MTQQEIWAPREFKMDAIGWLPTGGARTGIGSEGWGRGGRSQRHLATVARLLIHHFQTRAPGDDWGTINVYFVEDKKDSLTREMSGHNSIDSFFLMEPFSCDWITAVCYNWLTIISVVLVSQRHGEILN